jgi:hypothetical protein
VALAGILVYVVVKKVLKTFLMQVAVGVQLWWHHLSVVANVILDCQVLVSMTP